MIAYFFKQSKPVVFFVLFSGLSACFFLELNQVLTETPDLKSFGIYASKYIALIATFLIFISVLKQFEVQKRHSLGSLYFVLFSAYCMPFLIKGNHLFALFFISLGIYNCYKLIFNSNTNLILFQVVVLFSIAGLLEPTYLYLLLMVSVSSFLFTAASWRLFIIPVYAIGTVVLWCQVYSLIVYNSFYGYDFFVQKWTFNFDILNSTNAIALFVFWLLVFVLFVYQFIKVKEKRAIFHRNNARFFIFFVLIAVVSQILTTPSLEKLWILSIWPFAIYIADFVWRIRRRLWAEISVLISIAGIALMLILF